MSKPTPDAWDTLIEEMKWWVKTHHTSYAPHTATSRDVDGKPYRLGAILARRRMEYHQGLLSSSQIRDLESLPGWTWNGVKHRAAENWNRDYAVVLKHYNDTGSLKGLDVANPNAARWLRRQVDAGDDLPPARRKLLEKIPGALADRKSVNLDSARKLSAAITAWLAAKEGRTVADIRARTVHELDGERVRIGYLVGHRRQQYADGTIDPAVVELLEQVPGWYWTEPEPQPAEAGAHENQPEVKD